MPGTSRSTLSDKKLVFIVGSGRSGTTWLREILGQSPAVASAPETHLFDEYLRSFFGACNTFGRRQRALSALFSEAELHEMIRSLAENVFRRILNNRPEAAVILEKTPRHSLYAEHILELYPDSYFVHVVRDPRAVVNSLRHASRSWGARWAPSQVYSACHIWKQRSVAAQRIGQRTPRVAEVRYEDLHANAHREVMRLFAWLNEPVDDKDAAQYVAGASLAQMRRREAEKRPQEAALVVEFFRRGEIDSWKTELSPTEIALVERLTRKQMLKLGYEPVSGRRSRLAAKARLKTYRAADRFAKAVRAGADRLKP